MNVTLQTNKLNNGYQANNVPVKAQYQPQFTGGAKVVGQAAESKLFNPIHKMYDNLAEWIAKNYYERFYRSKFAEKFIEKISKIKNPKIRNQMTNHMSAIGATLISGMYAVRTLKNDKLDPQKRKTLALNDAATWAISTAGSYFLDSKLDKVIEPAITRFAAVYLQNNPRAKRLRTLGNWAPEKIYEYMEKGHSAVNSRIDALNKRIADSLADGSYKGARRPNLKHIEAEAAKSIRDFNLDILKNRRLTTLIDGMGVLKSLFVFGMVYRYIVPVLVMKPVNIISNHFHDKKAKEAALLKTQTPAKA